MEEAKIRLTPANSAMTRLAILQNNDAISSPGQIKLLQVTYTALLIPELDVDNGSGDPNRGL